MSEQQPIIMALDTSSRVSSVALCEAGTLIAESVLNLGSTHSNGLLSQIDTLLKQAGRQLTDLDLLAVVSGPGAFTGIRIGVATVKGLAQVLNIPVVTITSLQAAALNVPLSRLPVAVLLDARKKEVYCQRFAVDGDTPRPLDQARVLAPERFLDEIDGDVCLVGDGVPVYRDLIRRRLGDRAYMVPDCCHPVQASRVAWLSWRNYRHGIHNRPEQVVPFYIRPSDAEISRMDRLDARHLPI